MSYRHATALVKSAGIFALLLGTGCSGSPSESGETTPESESSAVPAPEVPVTTVSHKDWARAMAKVGTPKPGCFRVEHPSTTWEEIPCTKSTRSRPLVPSRPMVGGAGVPFQVGDGAGDAVANVSDIINYAEGSFPTVTGVTNEVGLIPPSAGVAVSTFSLQLNTNYDTTHPLCTAGPNSGTCAAWQQYVYIPSGQELMMQHWLIGYSPAKNATAAACPPGFGAYDNATYSGTTVVHEYDCFQTDSVANTPVPVYSFSNLSELMLAGLAAANDEVMLYSQGVMVAYTAPGTSVLGLNQWWNSAEFNIFGPGWGSAAVFNYGSTMSVQLITDSFSPSTISPSCGSTSYTGEINNLNVVPNSCCPINGSTQGIFFTQSNVPGAAAFACP